LDKWEIAIRAFSRVKDIPSEVGSTLIVQYVEDGAAYVEQSTGQSVTLTDIASKFHSPLTAFTTAMICGYKEGVGVSYNLGTMKIDKGTELDGVSNQYEQSVKLFNMGIQALGRNMNFEKTEPSDAVN
jgi:hypothetical protein